ncbi:hypothetical protein [Micromonospora sp. NPDC057140]
MDNMLEPADEPGTDRSPRLSVGDPELRKTRRLARECDTCIFKPGNLMRLSEGRLRDLVAEARRNESFVVCHDTLPHYRNRDVKPAICRGFADRYSTQALQVIERLFGFIEVDPPFDDLGRADGIPTTQDSAIEKGEPGSAD